MFKQNAVNTIVLAHNLNGNRNELIPFANKNRDAIVKLKSEYDQEIPQSHIADQPTAP